MKLQYLGDSRDAFKWDLLHWLCTQARPPFGCLVFVPLLTHDDPNPRDGQTPHARFPARPFIRPFLDTLRREPRTLQPLRTFGSVDGQDRFRVLTLPESRYVEAGPARVHYWRGWPDAVPSDSLVFFDPDNGFETKTQRGAKWLRHRELEDSFRTLGPDGVAVVYQHRPQRQTWTTVFSALAARLSYVDYAIAAHEANIAFVVLGQATSRARVVPALESYVVATPRVSLAHIR